LAQSFSRTSPSWGGRSRLERERACPP
jgi:hypothetical protein